VKLIPVTLFVVVSLGLLCLAQNPHANPGMRHAQELESQNERGFPPPNASRPALKVAELQGEAGQLADQAASVPAGVEHAGKGLIEKDLIQKLKRIEKLSKHLRNELER
jgi:hypothetical protein